MKDVKIHITGKKGIVVAVIALGGFACFSVGVFL